MKKGNIILIVVIVAVIGLALIFMGSYNGMLSNKENVSNSAANLETMLQRRADLIPNLVSTVKGYTSHETEIINKITEARAKLNSAKNLGDKANANNELSAALSSLMLIVENYPDLKSSANFIQLSDELAGTENRIATARKDYNDEVKSYNLSIKKFPNNLMAGMFGFTEESYFEASEGADKVPVVEF